MVAQDTFMITRGMAMRPFKKADTFVKFSTGSAYSLSFCTSSGDGNTDTSMAMGSLPKLTKSYASMRLDTSSTESFSFYTSSASHRARAP
jgi:hypothetical protein